MNNKRILIIVLVIVSMAATAFASSKYVYKYSSRQNNSIKKFYAYKKPVKPPVQNPAPQKPEQNNNSAVITAYEQEALNLLNVDRAANGLPALKANASLARLAENYAQDMITRGYFSHNNPEGLSPFDRMQNAGISYRYAGENLAINVSIPAAQKALMNSPGHRANILNPNFTQVGIGVKKHSNGSIYVVQKFIGI